MDLENLRRLIEYDQWANQEVLTSLKQIEQRPTRSLQFLAHIIAAEWLWLVRIKTDSKRVVVWPEMTLTECEAQLPKLKVAWDQYFAGITPASLTDPISYVNSKGESWSNAVADILMHVVLHSSAHRGQIASDIRAAGQEPFYTDFIEAVRRGFIE